MAAMVAWNGRAMQLAYRTVSIAERTRAIAVQALPGIVLFLMKA
jgi:hypothetical protein